VQIIKLFLYLPVNCLYFRSGMLESGIDRIISQVVDPKINHTFRPQVEKAVHEFLATLNHKEEAAGSTAPDDEKPESSVITQGALLSQALLVLTAWIEMFGF
jgi:hypothetical protein